VILGLECAGMCGRVVQKTSLGEIPGAVRDDQPGAEGYNGAPMASRSWFPFLFDAVAYVELA
jgi:hypothetical protein